MPATPPPESGAARKTPGGPTALIADDEPVLRDALAAMLARAWPALQVVAQARNGREAVELAERHRPDVCFLDIHMPGLSGIEAARRIGQHAHLVFVTAYDRYAVQAFEQGALDYLVKPVEPVRLADTVARLKQRLAAARPALDAEALLQALAERLQAESAGAATQHNLTDATAHGTLPLRWIRASIGQMLKLIAVDDVDFLRSDEKYTLIAWRGDAGQPGEALIRTPLKELVAQLDANHFVQVHRSVVVNLRSVSHVQRGANETADIYLKGRPEVLPVSRSYLHLFRQM